MPNSQPAPLTATDLLSMKRQLNLLIKDIYSYIDTCLGGISDLQTGLVNIPILPETAGLWTPILGGTTSESGQTYSTQKGYYTQIGKLVFATFHVTLTVIGTITGGVCIKGLPVASKSAAGYTAGGFVNYCNNPTGTPFAWVTLYMTNGVQYALVQYAQASASTTNGWTQSSLSSNFEMVGCIIYHTD